VRVLLWSEVFPPAIGGAEVGGAHFVRGMRRRGCEFVVITSNYAAHVPDESTYEGVAVYRFPFEDVLMNRDLDAMLRIRRRVAELKRAFKPDLTHVYFMGLGVVAHRDTESAWRAPLLVTLHGTRKDESYAPGSLYGDLLRSAGWVAACSEAVLRETRRQLPEILPRSSVVRGSLPMPTLPPVPLRLDPPRLLCVGRLSPEKGFDLALKAFATVAGRFRSARLIVAGDGPGRAGLGRRAEALWIAERVDFLGWVEPEDVPALLNTASLVIVPSRIESLGLVPVQAAQMGRPVVATRVGGLPEVVVDGQTGVLVDPEDSRALAEAIADLLRHPDKARRLGEAARRRVEAEFRWEDHLDAYSSLYHELNHRDVPGPLPPVGYPGEPAP
jgi:glycogen(starch) synthase